MVIPTLMPALLESALFSRGTHLYLPGPFLTVISIHHRLPTQASICSGHVNTSPRCLLRVTAASLSTGWFDQPSLFGSYPRVVPGTSGGAISVGGTVHLKLFSYEEWSPGGIRSLPRPKKGTVLILLVQLIGSAHDLVHSDSRQKQAGRNQHKDLY